LWTHKSTDSTPNCTDTDSNEKPDFAAFEPAQSTAQLSAVGITNEPTIESAVSESYQPYIGTDKKANTGADDSASIGVV
jgi:hypothetical protein